jgi:hypothetical protein
MAGASGYLLKQIRGSSLVEGIRQVAAGRSLLDPAVTKKLLDRLREPAHEDSTASSLTAREREISIPLARCPVRTLGPRNRDRRPWTGIGHHQMLELHGHERSGKVMSISQQHPVAATTRAPPKKGTAMRALVVYESMYGNTGWTASACVTVTQPRSTPGCMRTPFSPEKASKGIAGMLHKHGFQLAAEPISFLVDRHNHRLVGRGGAGRAVGRQARDEAAVEP